MIIIKIIVLYDNKQCNILIKTYDIWLYFTDLSQIYTILIVIVKI